MASKTYFLLNFVCLLLVISTILACIYFLHNGSVIPKTEQSIPLSRLKVCELIPDDQMLKYKNEEVDPCCTFAIKTNCKKRTEESNCPESTEEFFLICLNSLDIKIV